MVKSKINFQRILRHSCSAINKNEYINKIELTYYFKLINLVLIIFYLLAKSEME